ncbi:hypothetical protein L1887_21271 [Cichorium endivia]|nr:hypothetical protein L1887_21271 [Cichorium endivia]
MDRLVKPDVKELNLVFTRTHKCSATFQLTNLMHTMSVAVILDTTNPSRFYFHHPLAVLPPLATVSFTLFLSDQPPLAALPDTVLVRSSIVLAGKTNQENLHLLFSKPGRHIFNDATIPIHFVGHDILDFLLSSPISRTINTSFALSQAIQFCNETELTSLLRSSAKKGNLLFVSSLVTTGANVNHRDVDGESVMSLAIRSGNVDVVRVIVESNFVIDHSVDRFLHDAARVNGEEIMEVLCMSYLDIDINSVDSRGQTALHIAASLGYIEVLQFLVTLGSDSDVVDNNGWTPLHCASSEGHVAAVEFLLSSSIFVKYAVTKDGKTAIALAYENDHKDLYDMLYLRDVLHRAATANDVNGLNKCLEEGAMVNGKDQNGWTALHRAAFKGRVESVEFLLSHGARVDVVDNDGCTPLHRAVDAGHGQVAMLLVAQGARASMKSLIDHMVFDIGSSKNHSFLVDPLC